MGERFDSKVPPAQASGSIDDEDPVDRGIEETVVDTPAPERLLFVVGEDEKREPLARGSRFPVPRRQCVITYTR